MKRAVAAVIQGCFVVSIWIVLPTDTLPAQSPELSPQSVEQNITALLETMRRLKRDRAGSEKDLNEHQVADPIDKTLNALPIRPIAEPETPGNRFQGLDQCDRDPGTNSNSATPPAPKGLDQACCRGAFATNSSGWNPAAYCRT